MNEKLRIGLAIGASIAILLGFQAYMSYINPPQPASETANISTTAAQSAAAAANQGGAGKQMAVREIPSTETGDLVDHLQKGAKLYNSPLSNDSKITITNSHLTLNINKHTGNIYSARITPINSGQKIPFFNENGMEDYLKLRYDYDSGYVCGIDYITSDTPSITCSATGSEYKITKTYTLLKDSYSLDASATVVPLNQDGTPARGATSAPMKFELLVGPDFGTGLEPVRAGTNTVAMGSPKDFAKKKMDKVKKVYNVENPTWGGYNANFFLFAPYSKGGFDNGTFQSYGSFDGDRVLVNLDKEVAFDANGAALLEYNIFIGPKNYSLLKGLDSTLSKAINYGWLAFLAIPMYYILEFFFSIVGNYGWAIVLLTIAVRIIMFPLSLKGLKSIAKMQTIQPEIVKLKERYKDDPETYKIKSMELYKKKGVNPISGCLPILLTIPIFIALFKLLSTSVDLYGAPFIFWIDNLALYDKFYILPVAMGLLMFVQQLITPSTMDKTQRRVMLVLPLVFIGFLIQFPSGLTLYYTVSNFISILQQVFVNKYVHRANFRGKK